MSAITPFNERRALLLGEDAVARLAASRVAVVGIGGVGAYAVEMLARAGVGRLTLIDGDCVSPGNLNRQLPALHSTIARPKVALIEYCYRHKIDIIASMGAGGRTDPTQLRYADISDTFHDGLAREVRRRLKRNGITSGVKTVFSTEQPRRTALLYTDEIEFKTSSYGTVAWLPSMFGMMLAAYAVNRLTKS